MTQLSFVPARNVSRAAPPPPTSRLPGHFAVPVIVALALVSWLVVWQLAEAVMMVIAALT